MLYTRQVTASGNHIVEQNLSLAQAIVRRPLSMPRVEFPRDQAAEQQWDRQLREHSVEKFVLFNPGAGWGAKQWPAERYGAVARQLADYGLKSIVNFGPGEEDLARAVEASSGGVAEPFSGSLTELITLTRHASLFIGGDTGPLHLAAALRIPVVGIYGPTDPARNGPFGTSSIVLRSPSSLTTHARRGEPDEGLFGIKADQVVAAARELILPRGRCG
jgi:heptosyltransferase-1